MATVDEVIVKLQGDTSDLRRDLSRLESRFANTTKKLKSEMGTVNSAASSLRNALVALGAGVVAKSIVNTTVQFESLRNSLRAATGSTDAAAKAMEFVSAESNRLGIDVLVASKSFTSLAASARGTALEGEATRDIFTSVAEAARVMGLTSDQTQGALLALTQIMSKGTVQAEELRGQLGERIPGAFQIASRAMGVTTQELGKMLENGEVLAEDFLPKFAEELKASVAEGLPDAVDSAGASFTRLGNAITEAARVIGESGFVDTLADIADGAVGALEEISKFGKFLGETAAEFVTGVELGAEFADVISVTADETKKSGAAIEGLTPKVEKLTKEQQKLKNQFDKTFASLKLQAESYNLGAVEVELLALKTKGATEAQLQQAEAVLRVIESQKELDAEFEEALAVEEELVQIEKDRTATLMQEAEAVKNMIDPTRELQQELAKLEQLQGAGLISEDEFLEASFNVQERMEELVNTTEKSTEEMSQFWIQAARNMQNSLSDFLFDPFDEGLDGLASNFEKTIRKMAADLVASQLLEGVGSLFSAGAGGAGGGGLSGLISGFFANGGRPPVGRPAIVGDGGVPEVFTPDVSGTITPINQMGGPVTINNSITIQAPEGRISQPSLEQVQTQVGNATSSALRRNR